LIKLPSSAQTYQQIEGQLHEMNNPQAEQVFQQMSHVFSGPVGYASVIFQIIIAILIFIGAIKMLNLRSYEFAYAAAIISVIPCINPCCSWPLGLIFGIWCMVILGKLKQYFS
jgi:predicted PurR-regulated permease PerM